MAVTELYGDGLLLNQIHMNLFKLCVYTDLLNVEVLCNNRWKYRLQ